jgi:hypothetical protein
MTSKNIVYKFEELHPYWPHDVMVSGEADIECEWVSAEPDVGILYGGWGISIQAIRINSNSNDTPPWHLDHESELFKKIEKALLHDHEDVICDEAGDHDDGPDPDDAYDRMRDEGID